MIDKQTILEISEPVSRMYQAAGDRLLVNMASHFKGKKNLPVDEWQARMLGEVGLLTEESIAIIASSTGKAPSAIKSAIEKAVGMSLEDVERDLAEAAKRGFIRSPGGDIFASERIQSVIKNLTDQAVKDTNLVNTVMLNSTLGRYRAAVEFATEEAGRIEALMSITNEPELLGRLDQAQALLNEGAGSVGMATATRQQGLRRAIGEMAKAGITGFIDAGGHHWTPEAYVNMDIRTTVHNAMIQGQKARSADYGVTTFQVSTKAAARPLCAPYQGKILSWSPGDRGTVYDLRGNAYQYQSIYDTSYGEPAGLFGINCGHSPQTFVSGYSLPRYRGIEDEEQEKRNERQYAVSQEQRSMEREIRKAKTEAAAYYAAGDLEGVKKSAAKIKKRSDAYTAFCVKENLPESAFRTEVYSFDGRKVAREVKKINSDKKEE